MGKHTGGVSFAALKGNKGRFSTLFATQKGDRREAIAFLRGNMKQEKHKIRCSEIEKHLGKSRFFEKPYKDTRTKFRDIPDGMSRNFLRHKGLERAAAATLP